MNITHPAITMVYCPRCHSASEEACMRLVKAEWIPTVTHRMRRRHYYKVTGTGNQTRRQAGRR